MRNYELVLILYSQLDEETVSGVLSKVEDVLKKKKSAVTKIDKWGKRRLAYTIKHENDGIYYLVRFKATTEGVKELDRILSIADEVLRFMIVVDETKVA